VVLRLADDGPGIPAQIRARLFQPFVTGSSDGTGLGLAITKRIVEAHGGAIEVETLERGKAPELAAGGTTFSITLPVSGPSRPGSPR
jgi:signal transduction histidine kinase